MHCERPQMVGMEGHYFEGVSGTTEASVMLVRERFLPPKTKPV